MTDEHHAWDSLHPMHVATGRPATCACGQELDTCSGSHCPRCGTHLAPRAA